MTAPSDPRLAVAAELRRWRAHPAAMVRELFRAEPDSWQEFVLELFPHRPRLAMQAAKGPGKTTLLAWLCWNFLLTRPHPKIPATSISEKNLRDNLWSEMSKWQKRSDLLAAQFVWTNTKIYQKDHPETWFMVARTWPRTADQEEQAKTLAGYHAEYILFVLDEAGGIPVPILVTAEAALAAATEAHIVLAGNPTDLDGALHHACVTHRKLWEVVEITGDPDDPKRATRISIEWARQQIEQYGRDNPWVLINVLGKFPPTALNALISTEEVQAAMDRLLPYHFANRRAKVLGVDVARFGGDASVIFPRQGLVAHTPSTLRNLDGIEGAGAVSALWNQWGADACFIDDSGGYGSSWIDNCKLLGLPIVGVQFAGKARDPRYFNKRAEMYMEMVGWIRAGGLVPRVPELLQTLPQMTYSFRGDMLLLEPKESLKSRLGYSPDHADALALTFAAPVQPRSQETLGKAAHSSDYNPMAEFWK